MVRRPVTAYGGQSFMASWRESNPLPEGFQSSALPSELHVVCVCNRDLHRQNPYTEHAECAPPAWTFLLPVIESRNKKPLRSLIAEGARKGADLREIYVLVRIPPANSGRLGDLSFCMNMRRIM